MGGNEAGSSVFKMRGFCESCCFHRESELWCRKEVGNVPTYTRAPLSKNGIILLCPDSGPMSLAGRWTKNFSSVYPGTLNVP